MERRGGLGSAGAESDPVFGSLNTIMKWARFRFRILKFQAAILLK
jgi:hypothetical protein